METEKRQAGNFGEKTACEYLKKKGFELVARNWSCKAGEVDLVMRDVADDDTEGSTLVFVEVRLRRPTKYGEGLETVAFEKQRKLIRTAQYYQQREGYWGDVRFDVVSIVLVDGREPEIEHVEHAFETGV